MNTLLTPEKPVTKSKSKSFIGAVDGFCKSALFSKLSKLEHGRLIIRDGDELRVFGETTPPSERNAAIVVKRPEFYTRAALGGSIGAGESYAEGDWECDDLSALVRIFVANREILSSIDGGLGALLQPIERLLHKARRNTIENAKDNIRAHYDLGNDFFSLFLDPTMMYSCGIFEKPESTMFDASTAKNDRICRKLKLSSKDHLLEIGTGWGAFAIHAAKNYGCRVTTTTISPAQYEMAKKRIHAAGLEGQIELLLVDYRNLTGQYDKLVSIEMIEAVGLDNLDTYFKVCGERLKDSGSMLLQAIIIQDQFYEQAKKSVDFIQKHIFPGSGIPSVSSIVGAVAKKTDLRLFHQEDLTAHYCRTLAAWNQNLQNRKSEMLELGYTEHLFRLWEFYFGYCAGGFAERSIGLVQMLFTKPRSAQPTLLGDL